MSRCSDSVTGFLCRRGFGGTGFGSSNRGCGGEASRYDIALVNHQSKVRGRRARLEEEQSPNPRIKDNEESTQVIIRDLFCKRCRAMLQYGTPDWARPASPGCRFLGPLCWY